jgi:hypothetical protein
VNFQRPVKILQLWNWIIKRFRKMLLQMKKMRSIEDYDLYGIQWCRLSYYMYQAVYMYICRTTYCSVLFVPFLTLYLKRQGEQIVHKNHDCTYTSICLLSYTASYFTSQSNFIAIAKLT